MAKGGFCTRNHKKKRVYRKCSYSSRSNSKSTQCSRINQCRLKFLTETLPTEKKSSSPGKKERKSEFSYLRWVDSIKSREPENRKRILGGGRKARRATRSRRRNRAAEVSGAYWESADAEDSVGSKRVRLHGDEVGPIEHDREVDSKRMRIFGSPNHTTAVEKFILRLKREGRKLSELQAEILRRMEQKRGGAS